MINFGPLLFLLYINDIVNDIGAKISFFADDIGLSINVENPVMVAACLNTDLLKLSHWVATWLVMFNPTKTKSRIFSRKLNKPLHPPLFMEKQQIVEVESHKHLGVIFSAVCTYSQGARSLKIDLRVRLALLNRFKPSSKLFYLPFQGGSSFVDLLCFCSVLCLLCLCKPVLGGHTGRPKIGFPDKLSLSEGFKYC